MQSYDGLTKRADIQRSDKFCPRCNTPTVDRDNRICWACSGRLLWYGDDATYFNDNLIWWYMWYKSPFTNFYGWYDKSYFRDNIL